MLQRPRHDVESESESEKSSSESHNDQPDEAGVSSDEYEYNDEVYDDNDDDDDEDFDEMVARRREKQGAPWDSNHGSNEEQSVPTPDHSHNVVSGNSGTQPRNTGQTAGAGKSVEC